DIDEWPRLMRFDEIVRASQARVGPTLVGPKHKTSNDLGPTKVGPTRAPIGESIRQTSSAGATNRGGALSACQTSTAKLGWPSSDTPPRRSRTLRAPLVSATAERVELAAVPLQRFERREPGPEPFEDLVQA